jgi:hypothetical protein
MFPCHHKQLMVSFKHLAKTADLPPAANDSSVKSLRYGRKHENIMNNQNG